MKTDIEKRLHRVIIKLDKRGIKGPYSKYCDSAKNCNRCNQYYSKCSKYTDFSQDSLIKK